MDSFDAVRVLTESAKEYVCCSKLFSDQRLEISLCDGERVWKHIPENVSLLLYKFFTFFAQSAGGVQVTSMNDCLQEGRVELNIEDSVSLTLHCQEPQNSSVSFQLAEVTGAEGKEEIGLLVLKLAKKTTQLTVELKDCKDRLESALKAKVSAAAVPDMPIKSSGKTQNKPRKPAGHSIVNPSSKRRKAAKGVVWNEDDQ